MDELDAKMDEIWKQCSAKYGDSDRVFDEYEKLIAEIKPSRLELHSQWLAALYKEGKALCSSCNKVFQPTQKRDGSLYKTCPRCREPTRYNKAWKAVKECAQSRDFLNCRPCPHHFQRTHDCVLNDEFRLEIIRSLEGNVRFQERYLDSPFPIRVSIKQLDKIVQENTGYKTHDESLGAMKAEVDFLKSYDVKIKPKRTWRDED
jgi:hypothetical protein